MLRKKFLMTIGLCFTFLNTAAHADCLTIFSGPANSFSIYCGYVGVELPIFEDRVKNEKDIQSKFCSNADLTWKLIRQSPTKCFNAHGEPFCSTHWEFRCIEEL